MSSELPASSMSQENKRGTKRNATGLLSTENQQDTSNPRPAKRQRTAEVTLQTASDVNALPAASNNRALDRRATRDITNPTNPNNNQNNTGPKSQNMVAVNNDNDNDNVNRHNTDNRANAMINQLSVLIHSPTNHVLVKLHGIGDDWNWCIFDLHAICGDSTLLITTHYIFEQLNLFDKFSIKLHTFQSFFSVIQRGYQANPYHNSLHGADVLVNMYYWIKSWDLSDVDVLTALLSAACHDYMHPGLNEGFQITTKSDMALKYDSQSVLENMHYSETIKLLSRPEYAILGSLEKTQFEYACSLMKKMILGTDMKHCKEHVQTLQGSGPIDKNKLLVTGLHVADISNPCKPWLDCKRWTFLLMEEWFRQGEKEMSMGLEVSPMMDRSKQDIPSGQVKFIDYVVKPLFINWWKLYDKTSVCIQNLMINRQNWILAGELYTELKALESAPAKTKRTQVEWDAKRLVQLMNILKEHINMFKGNTFPSSSKKYPEVEKSMVTKLGGKVTWMAAKRRMERLKKRKEELGENKDWTSFINDLTEEDIKHEKEKSHSKGANPTKSEAPAQRHI